MAAGTSLVTAALCGLFALVGLPLTVNLAVLGLLYAGLVAFSLELRRREGRRRKVLVLDYRAHEFGNAVARGVRATLGGDHRHWYVETRAPRTADATGAVAWQVRELQEADLADFDGVVLIPAEDSNQLWYALASLIKDGVFVVAVDTKPPNQKFRELAVDPPRFVSSRYSETGVLIGTWLCEWLGEDPSRRCVLMHGPSGSWPGEERSRNIVYELGKAGMLERAALVPMASWTPSNETCAEVLRHVERCDGEVAVYCGDDENAHALHLATVLTAGATRSRMWIIGCNATPDEAGNVRVLDERATDVTVDILAQQIGETVASLFVRERKGKLPASERTVQIDPVLKVLGVGGTHWLASLTAAYLTQQAVDDVLGHGAVDEILDLDRTLGPGTTEPDAQ